jgi:hypothetical protein
LKLFEQAREFSVSACGRTPAHVCNFDVLPRKVEGEYLKADIDDPRRRGEQISQTVTTLFGHLLSQPYVHLRDLAIAYAFFPAASPSS